MSQTYTAVRKERSGCWIGWIKEVPGVNCQEVTREELLGELGVTLREALDSQPTASEATLTLSRIPAS